MFFDVTKLENDGEKNQNKKRRQIPIIFDFTKLQKDGKRIGINNVD
jgi:hypothetical protein